jgi:hypothetical protein
MRSRSSSFAIIGGGSLGTLLALQLSNLGFNVCVFEKNQELLKGASYLGEGKIHLGYTFGLADEASILSFIESAFSFKPIFENALNHNIEWSQIISSPFVYKVDENSIITIEHFIKHASNILRLIKNINDNDSYLNIDRNEVMRFHRISERNFLTGERALDVVLLSSLIKNELNKRSNISVLLNQNVESVKINSANKYAITTPLGNSDEDFDYVINCTWNNRNILDKNFVEPVEDFNYRTKLYVSATTNLEEFAMTTVLGKFGDLIIFKSGRLYASDYLTGLSSFETGKISTFRERDLIPKDLVDKHWSYLKSRFNTEMPLLDEVCNFETLERTVVASGDRDIDQIDSGLHHRLPFHFFRNKNYISALATKYTTVPLLSKKIVDGILKSELE